MLLIHSTPKCGTNQVCLQQSFEHGNMLHTSMIIGSVQLCYSAQLFAHLNASAPNLCAKLDRRIVVLEKPTLADGRNMLAGKQALSA